MPDVKPKAPTEDVTAAIARKVAAGWPLRLAAHRVGLPPELAEKWFEIGRAGGERYVAYFDAVTAADREDTVRLLRTIVAATDRGSKRAARFLKRFQRQNPDVPIPTGVAAR